MLFAFAISSSAESTCEIVWYFPEGTSFNTIQEGTEEYNFKCEFEGSFTTLKFDAKDSNDNYKKVVALNVLEFQNFCKLYNLTDISSFNSFMNSLNGQEGISTEVYNWSSPFTYDFLNEESFNFFYNYNLITQDDVDSAIDEGKVAGVTEYKSSEEYATALNAKYNDGFVNGTAEGALSYIRSDAYKTALSNEYDSGYDAGFDQGYIEGEAQFDIAPFIGVISIIALISIGIVIVCWGRKKRIG